MNDIIGLIAKGEGISMEFKESLPAESTKWLKTVVAFANCYGGMLIVGVTDAGKVVGVSGDSAFTILDSMVSAVCDSCYPQIPMSTSVQDLDGKSIIILEVFPGNNGPYHIKSLGEKEGTFIRVGGTSRIADESMIHELMLHSSNTTFDVLENHDIEVTEERTRRICEGLSSLNGSLVTESILRNAGLICSSHGRDIATNAYALMCDDSPFRFCEVRCAVFGGEVETDFMDRADFSCPIYKQIGDAYSFVKRNLRLQSKVRGLYREDKCEIPPVAVREAIVNAIQHRSYVDLNKPIYVALYEDRLEIRSPGGIPSSLSLDLIKQGHSYQRNPVISMVFRAAAISEGWGNGVKSIMRTCREYDLPEPLIENSGIDFTITIFRPGFEGSAISSIPQGDVRRRILSAIEVDPGITASGLSDLLDVPQRTVEREISSLKREGIILRAGSTRNGQWVVHRLP
ncbi:MAG: RNA-binding domain-containing protein [Candidatus Methanomethylophilaceae archaeon]